jgi:hypothetical protein
MLTIVLLTDNSRRELLRSLRSPVIWGLSLPVIGGNFLDITAYQMAPVGSEPSLDQPSLITFWHWVRRV